MKVNKLLLYTLGDEFLVETKNLFGKLEIIEKSDSNSALQEIKEFYSNIVKLVKGYQENKCILFNNDPATHHVDPLEAMQFFPSPALLIVRRDPRDAFSDLVRKDGYEPSEYNVSLWISRQKKALTRLESIDDSENVRVIDFENFVFCDNLRGDISTWLGLNSRRQHSHFEPKESSRNIGIWKSYECQKTMDRIRNELHNHYQF